MEIGELQTVNEQLEQNNIKLWEDICLLKDQVSYLTHQCILSSQSTIVAPQQMLSVQTTQHDRPEISALSLKGDDKKVHSKNWSTKLQSFASPLSTPGATSFKRGQEEQNFIIR